MGYSKETLVGRVTLTYEDGEAVGTMEAGEGLWFKNVHAYVGQAQLPVSEDSEVIDPFSYPVFHDRMSLSRTFSVGGFDGSPIHFIAEATVCGIFPSGEKAAEGTQGPLFSKLF